MCNTYVYYDGKSFVFIWSRKKRFEICSRANRWDAATKALRLPTLLEEEALAIWMDLSAEEKDNSETVKQTLTSKLTPLRSSLAARPYFVFRAWGRKTK